MSEKPTNHGNEEELVKAYEDVVKRLPTRAPIFLPTERVPLKERLEGVKRVEHIYKNRLKSVYGPKIQALRKKHNGSKRCFIIGNGPSLNDTDLELLKDEITFAVNGFFLKAEDLSWKPTYYVVEDHLVAEDRLPWINKFKGPTKLFPAYLGYCFEEADDTIFYNHRPRVSYPDGFDFSTDASQITYAGCTVTFSCMQLAFYMGFEEIYLIGVDASYEIPKDVDDSDEYNVGVLDMKSDDPNHFHPDYFGKGFRWHDPQVHKMVEAYGEARRVIEKTSSRIYNATIGGKLEVFQRVSYDSLFEESRGLISQSPEPSIHSEQFPKVMIYDITLSGDGTATGEIKSNLFEVWPNNLLGQFYSTGRDKIGWHSDGQVGATHLSQQDALELASSFDPDVILYRPVMDNFALHDAAMTALSSLGRPFVTWYMDDWPERFKIENPEKFARMESDLNVLIENSETTLVIGEKMSVAYEKRYGREFIPLANGVKEIDWPEPDLSEIKGRPFKFRYAGSLAANMTLQSLLNIAQAIETLSNKYDLVFEIKTRKVWYDKVKKHFKKYKATTFIVENLSTEKYRQWISGADSLVIAYNFDERSTLYTRYSVANKMPECLASGVPVFAYGPHDIATIELMKKNDCALVLTDPKKSALSPMLERLIISFPLRKYLSRKGRAVAFKNHNISNLSAQLKGILSSAHLPQAPRVSSINKQEVCAIIIGNGPSLKGFEFAKLDKFSTFGMNAAYRYWDDIQWYPDYYSCLDLTVGLSHKNEIRRLIENAHLYKIRKFLLRENLIAKLSGCINFDRIVNFDDISKEYKLLSSPTITTGSHTAAWAAVLGYTKLFLLGIDCNYVDIVDGAVKRGKTELIIKEENYNPNYFFNGYQKKGDIYQHPNPGRNVHLQSWREIKDAVKFTDVTILNANLKSKVDAFDFCQFKDINVDGNVKIIDKHWVLDKSQNNISPIVQSAVTSSLLSDITYSREAQAGFDETFLIYKMYEAQLPGVMIDVGAHYGGSARPFAKKGWTIFCQEPDANNRAHLVKSLGKNPFVKIDDRAVGERSEKGRIFYSSNESTGISGMLAFRDTHKQSATVDVTTVENIIDDNHIKHVNFLKIDVEGYDFGVLKGVPWETMKPDVIECEFEDAKTKHLGHTWRDICDYLTARDYTVYVSEWHPIVRYGISHDWRALKKYPCNLDDENAWGNLLAFKVDPGEAALCKLLRQVLKYRNKNYVHSRTLLEEPIASDSQVEVETALKLASSIKKAEFSTRSLSKDRLPLQKNMAPARKPESYANKLRRKSPVLFRVAQIGKLGFEFMRRHITLTILGLLLLFGLVFAPVFVSTLKPFAIYFWFASIGLLFAAGAFVGLSFANLMAHRIANREMIARQNLKNEILKTVEHDSNQKSSEIELTQKRLNAELGKRLSSELSELEGEIRKKESRHLKVQAQLEDMANNLSSKLAEFESETRKKELRHLKAQAQLEDMANNLSSKLAEFESETRKKEIRHLKAQAQFEDMANNLSSKLTEFESETRKKELRHLKVQAQFEDISKQTVTLLNDQLIATNKQLSDAQKQLDKEGRIRKELSAELSKTSSISKLALERIEKESKRNSTSFTQAQEHLEARLEKRLKDTESQLSKTRQSLAEAIAQLEINKQKSLKENQIVQHQHFNRSLTKEHMGVFKENWLKHLNLNETDRSLAYMGDRISNIERTLKGRLATSIENAVLRTLIAKSVNGKELKVLEIGVLFGIGLAMIYDRTVDLYDNVHITALDPFEGYYGDNALDILTQERVTRNVFIQNMEAARVPKANYSLIEGYSSDDDVIEAAAKDLYDVLIIDGDHSYAGVKSDFVNYAPMVKRGGYILIDDYTVQEWPEITQYVDDELIPRSDISLVGRDFRTAVFKVIQKVKS